MEKRGGEVLLTIEAPDAVKGSILLPNGYTFKDATGEQTQTLRAGQYVCVKT